MLDKTYPNDIVYGTDTQEYTSTMFARFQVQVHELERGGKRTKFNLNITSGEMCGRSQMNILHLDKRKRRRVIGRVSFFYYYYLSMCVCEL